MLSSGDMLGCKMWVHSVKKTPVTPCPRHVRDFLFLVRFHLPLVCKHPIWHHNWASHGPGSKRDASRTACERSQTVHQLNVYRAGNAQKSYLYYLYKLFENRKRSSQFTCRTCNWGSWSSAIRCLSQKKFRISLGEWHQMCQPVYQGHVAATLQTVKYCSEARDAHVGCQQIPEMLDVWEWRKWECTKS